MKRKDNRGGHHNCGRKKIGDCEIRLRCFEVDKEKIKAYVKGLIEEHKRK
jgi:hypothetical protein